MYKTQEKMYKTQEKGTKLKEKVTKLTTLQAQGGGQLPPCLSLPLVAASSIYHLLMAQSVQLHTLSHQWVSGKLCKK